MATGHAAFSGSTSGVLFDAILNRAPVPAVRVNPDVPPKLEEIIDKLLEKDRDLRYQGAPDLRTDLKRLQRGSASGRALRRVPTQAGEAPLPEAAVSHATGALPSRRWSLTPRKKYFGLAACVAFLVGTFVVYRYWPPAT